jgi:hypothetical protein
VLIETPAFSSQSCKSVPVHRLPFLDYVHLVGRVYIYLSVSRVFRLRICGLWQFPPAVSKIFMSLGLNYSLYHA